MSHTLVMEEQKDFAGNTLPQVANLSSQIAVGKKKKKKKTEKQKQNSVQKRVDLAFKCSLKKNH